MSPILCGPIVRRTTTTAVYIWLATQQDEELSGEIRLRGHNEVISINQGSKKIQLGKNLFIHLVHLSPAAAGFPTDSILHYDILHKLPDNQKLSLLGDDQEIKYPGEPYPGFIIPGKLAQVLHGSCRKPQSNPVKKAWGNLDQLSSADDLLAESFQNPEERPSTLLMTGDQIYADDVSGPMLDHLIKLGNHITGWNEVMPRRRPPVWHGYNTPDDHNCAAEMPLYGRRPQLSKEFTGITSLRTRNHLMTFGEYAAMYLTVWGGPGAKTSFAPWSAVKTRASATASANSYAKEREQNEIFCQTLSKVRRLLANISVYMIFDDHEITDDWNINPAWEQKIHESPRARRVVSNGLAAYWAFQGWGNNPDRFDAQFMGTLAQHLDTQDYQGGKADAFDTLLWQKEADRWAYVIPTNPTIIVLDTRTSRQQGKRASSPAELMNQSALNWLKTELENAVDMNRKHVCLISATPVFGLKAIENLQQIAYVIGGSAAAVDLESWNEGLDELEAAITSVSKLPASIAILSGDVHYSFMRKSAFKSASGDNITVYQMTSSPFHNQAVPKLQFCHRDVLVQNGDFVVSEEKSLGKAAVITSINNLAQVNFDEHGQVTGQKLITTLPDGQKKYTTYKI
ncbi:PhoD-like phosphatase [Mariprofundus micogutta]|uniref:PhoD-like phosphatase n=1 Tax=Mariprofundus micogutta TaxID=1921010 RepID=A0A1L8CNF2_9PROT|nr:alkaline phosphatase D family protein [Mariprofundus micogutta]GAV20445.1 PhoD-like phosphatase [Mariprofundus micogutta]